MQLNGMWMPSGANSRRDTDRKNHSLYVRTTRPSCKQIGNEIDEQLSEQGLEDDDQCIQDDFFA
ncbi:hypothetical protein OROHE_012980 [Orobanche hederae]